MPRKLVGPAIVVVLSLAVSFAHGEPRRGGGGRSEGERSNEERSGGERSSGERSSGQSTKGKKPPGGAWSEYNPEGKQGKEKSDAHNESVPEGAAAGAAHSNRNSPQASGAEGAAAGAAASNRNSPKASGAEGAAAGAAASNRNNPKYSGAQGAAAGAAASNRNQPQYSGAQGAAAAAAAANRNKPQYSGAQGAAAGAAAANRNQPQYSGAGAAVGAAVANNNSPQYSAAAGAAAGYASVRNNVDHPGMFSQQWYGEHQAAFAPVGWTPQAPWVAPNWGAVATQCNYDIDVTPISYNYGSNVTCIGNNVLINGQSAGTAEEFSQQADAIAEKGTTAAASPNDKWLPLGVFALVRNEQQHPQLIMQLAVNQQGVLRGNYTDEVTDSTMPVHGAIDKKSQRAAWTIGDNRYSVIEAGLNNLTQGEAPALIHKNGTTQRWLLVRLSQATQGDAPK